MCVYVVCDESTLLSAERDFLGPITASSASDDDPAEDVVDTGSDSWCSSEPFQAGSAPYIQLNFSTPVVLTYMRARGESNFIIFLSYVAEFRLEVQDEESGDYLPYGVVEESTPTVRLLLQ